MDAVRVLVANDLRSYRQVLAAALRQLRPEIEVFEVRPTLLDTRLGLLRPDLVVCSRITSRVELDVPSWIEFHTDHEPRSIVCVAGHRSEIVDLQLEDLLSIVDELVGTPR